MSNRLTVWQPNHPAKRVVTRDLGRSLQRMQQVGDLARAAMDEVSEVNSYTMYKVTNTLAAGEQIKQADGGISPEQEASLHHLQRDYLQTMAHISSAVSTRIALAVDDASSDPNPGGAWHGFVDDFKRGLRRR